MKEQLISFETAKLAKEKGFNWKVSSHYESNGNRFFDKVECNFNNVELICSAPTQSLLQKWLREVHNIDITIHRSFSMNNSYHYCILINCNYDEELQQLVTPDRTYEEALETGLQEALKLI